MTLHELTADKLERADAETRQALLRIPLDNIDRWIANGHTAPQRLEKWRLLLHRAQQSPEGFRELLMLLRDRSPDTERLREFAPFAGVLTAAERAPFIRQCVYSH